MTADVQPAGSPHVEFLAWAADQGVVTRQIRAARIPNCGLGVVACEPIKAGTEIVRVPTSVLLTTNCMPKAFIEKHDVDMTVHGLLASFLTNGSSSPKEMGRYRHWEQTWPTYDDFVECMPILWPQLLRERWQSNRKTEGSWLLPPGIGARNGSWDYTKKPVRKGATESLIGTQLRKLQCDEEKALAAFPDMSHKDFVRNWLIVNTRSFYYDEPLRRKPLVHEDKMIMCPVIDYFNHSDDGCTANYNKTGYYVVADRDYQPGEEIFVSYGAHDSDLLLAEYGFVPAHNRFDCVLLDPWVLAPSTEIEKKHSARLRKAGYLDSYYITAVSGEGQVCHRTQVAVRAATMKPNRWLQYVRGKFSAEGHDEACNFLSDQILQPLKRTVQASISGLVTLDSGSRELIRAQIEHPDHPKCFAHIISTLNLRWKQIDTLIDQAIDNIDD